MKQFTLLFTFFAAFAITAVAQTEGEEGNEATKPTIWLLESNDQNYTELQYFTVATDADRLEMSGRGKAQLVSVNTGAALTMDGYPIGYSMALLQTPTAIKAVGQWKVVIPEGYYTLTKEDVSYPSPAYEVVFNIAPLEDFKIVSITPENGSTLASLEKIMLVFNYPPMDCYDVLKVVNSTGDSVCDVRAYNYDEEGNWYSGWLTMRLELSDTIVEKGSYYIHIPDSTFKKQADQITPIPEMRLMFHVDGSQSTGILPVVNQTVSNAIFDITGRKVEMITTPGLYIINGKKRYIK